MARHSTFYVTWTRHHPRFHWATPERFLAVAAVNQDVAIAAVTELADTELDDGWRIQADPPGQLATGPVGCSAVLWVGDDTADLFVRRASDGHFIPEPARPRERVA